MKNEIQGREHLLRKTDKDDWSAVHFAAKGGNLEIFSALISDKAILLKTNEQMTVLHIAAKYSNYDICKFILENDEFRELLREKSCLGKNACHYAAEGGSRKILKLLVKNKELNVNETTNDGQNIFHIACIHGNLDMCQFIAENYNKLISAVDNDAWNATLYAAKQGHIHILKFLRANGVSFNNQSKSKRNALHIACDNGHKPVCEFIVKVCPSLLEEKDYKGRHAGHFAARSGNVPTMKFLNDAKLDVTKSTETGLNILHYACLYRRKEMCLYLLDTFPHLNVQRTQHGWTTAHFVAEKKVNLGNEIEIFEIITNAKENCRIEEVTHKRNSILTLAIKNNFYEFCEYLLQTHPDILDIPGAIHPKDIEKKDTKMSNIIERYIKLK
ncbi:putative ankyrin repeat protein RF_0381 [Saccostrea cucullata]|uniref:putative ankyrin repeat protein RF_0381 n=1 Tax=Saccostrea cuccullata TaxID=36930 RepID=UPI002ED49F06